MNNVNDEKTRLINEIKDQINKRKNYLLNQLPIVHTINDGIIIRFFDEWEESEYEDVKYIEIENTNDEDEGIKTYYFFLPKGSIFDIKEHTNIETMICLEGKMQIHYDDKVKMLNSYSRFTIPENTKHYGIAIQNSYMIVSSKI